MPKPKRGDLVEIVFDDHVEDDDCLLRFRVVGYLAQLTRYKCVVNCWFYDDDPSHSDGNVKMFTISRRDVVRINRLTREDG